MRSAARLIVPVLLLAFGLAQPSLSLAATAKSTKSVKSAKKLAADQQVMHPPQVIEPSDTAIGVRAGQGYNYEGRSVIGVNLERIIRQNFGLGGQVNYARYQTDYAVGPQSGEWKYEAWTFVLYGAFHADVLRVKNLDTFVTTGIAHNVLNSDWQSNTGMANPGHAKGNSTGLMAYLNARYFVDSSLGFTASIGSGVGTLAIGIDYLF